jgi:hypothetical protein
MVFLRGLRRRNAAFDHITQGALVRLGVGALDGIPSKHNPARPFRDDRLRQLEGFDRVGGGMPAQT